MQLLRNLLLFSALGLTSNAAFAQSLTDNPYTQAYLNRYGKLPTDCSAADRMMADYLQRETKSLATRWGDFAADLKDWETQKEIYRHQLFEMLGLEPFPSRSDLHVTQTGMLSHPEFTVEKLHFQSRPGLYCTANVYVPKNLNAPAPAILYLCGHGAVKEDGISLGNKVHYQHHGAWFARNGYICMVLDSVQLGEIEGIHHGTHRYDMWWWNSCGYTSAGAEAWNCIRAIDYLQSRDDVDPQRIGVTGRSGGGAYSWWVAALDERVKVACPVAGITDLQNHVIDGCVEGHCDCMFMVNTYRWDYNMVAALIAPRPLLICNTDRDNIFPLDGVIRLHASVRNFYDHYGAPEKLGLAITEGGHADRQELQVPVMRWFNKWLKNSDTPILNHAEKFFPPKELRVFAELPTDEITSRCFESFTVLAKEQDNFSPESAVELLRNKTFGAWPNDSGSAVKFETVGKSESGSYSLTIYEVVTQSPIAVRMYLLSPKLNKVNAVDVELMDDPAFAQFVNSHESTFGELLTEERKKVSSISLPKSLENSVAKTERKLNASTAYLFVAPRGVGLTSLQGDAKYRTQVRRRFNLLGSTLASGQAWDTLQCLKTIPLLDSLKDAEVKLRPVTSMTEVACFATLFGPKINSLELEVSLRDYQQAPDFLNWARIVTSAQLRYLVEQKTRLIVPQQVGNTLPTP